MKREVSIDVPDASAAHQIDRASLRFQHAITDFGIDDRFLNLDVDIREQTARRNLLARERHVHRVADEHPVAFARFERAHRGEVEVPKDVAEAGVDLRRLSDHTDKAVEPGKKQIWRD